MQYLTEDLADPGDPSAAELENWFNADPSRFELPESATFEQVFLSPDQRGDALNTDAEAALESLHSGTDPTDVGDRTPLDGRLVDAARARVEILFGAAMTEAIFSGPQDTWTGPYRSDFGVHLLRVEDVAPARVPSFAQIEDRVRQVYAEVRRDEANESAFAALRQRYSIVVEWPDEGGE